jgi:hypothetical protein
LDIVGRGQSRAAMHHDPHAIGHGRNLDHDSHTSST